MTDVDARLEKIEIKVNEIKEAVTEMAVQNERIINLQTQINSHQVQIDTMWAKYDALIAPDGVLPKIRNFQSSCPRDQIKWMWTVIIPLAVVILGVGIKLIAS